MKKFFLALILIIIFESSSFAARDRNLKSLKVRAANGDSEAMYTIGLMYHDGDGVNQDYAEALKWYKKAAEADNPKAYDNMGWMYQHGQGVNQDYKKAFECYQEGAEGDVPRSINQLGYFYENGMYVEADNEKAIDYYIRAANLGNVVSQYNAGRYYEYVKKDFSEAFRRRAFLLPRVS